MKHPMRLVSIGIFSIFLLLGLYVVANQQSGSAATENTIFITTKVTDGLTDKSLREIEQSLQKKTDLNIEYACLESGIMVYRLLHTELQAKGDVQALILNRLAGIIAPKAVKFLDIHFVTVQSGGNC